MTCTDGDGNWTCCDSGAVCASTEASQDLSGDEVCPDQACSAGHVRMVSSLSFDPSDASSGYPVEMIIDSGADESCLSLSMDLVGDSLGRSNPGFCDAQGHPLQIHDRRQCVMQFLNVDQKLQTFKESCLVSSVSSPLFAVGKLYKLGWGTFWHGDQFVLGLPGKPSTYIPCSFKHNSIVAQGWIRRVRVPSPSRVSGTVSSCPSALAPEPLSLSTSKAQDCHAKAAHLSSIRRAHDVFKRGGPCLALAKSVEEPACMPGRPRMKWVLC